MWLYGLGISILKVMSILSGLLMYAKYADCDPFTTKEVTKGDQLLPYYVMDVASKVPGLSGLFIAGVVSAALRYRLENSSCTSFLTNNAVAPSRRISIAWQRRSSKISCPSSYRKT